MAAENLFLRNQLAPFQERKLKPHHATDSARWLMAFVSRALDWRAALVVVKPDTLKGQSLMWHSRQIACRLRTAALGSGC